MKTNMEIAISVAKALNRSKAIVLDDIESGKAMKLYNQLQDIYSTASQKAPFGQPEKAWNVMKPVAEAMDDLWCLVEDDILAQDGISMVETDSTHVVLKTLKFWYEGYCFCVDIEMDTKENEYGAWLYGEGYGTKEFMFGSLVNSQRFGEPITETLESFTNTVLGVVADYLPDYIEEHMG